MKKMLSVLLIIAILCGAFTVVAGAAENASKRLGETEAKQRLAFITAYPKAAYEGAEAPKYWFYSATVQWILQYLLLGFIWMKYPPYMK